MMDAAPSTPFVFPDSLNAISPPEKRGCRRDYVRLMTIDQQKGTISHNRFNQLDTYLNKGDLLVLNTSRTIPAVLFANVMRMGKVVKKAIEVRLARHKGAQIWEALVLTSNVKQDDLFIFNSTLKARVTKTSRDSPLSELIFLVEEKEFYKQLYKVGEPIRYEYIKEPWNLDCYQTVFATVPGSVEMPSAGRPFSWELLFKLKEKGIRLAFLQLHTGLSYMFDEHGPHRPEDHPEQYHIPLETLQLIAETKASSGRVIAVGTTVVRALETERQTNEREGWTNLYIHRKYPLQVTDGILTGFHEPEASHLHLLSAFISEEYLMRAYTEAIKEEYLWHEFGDMNLII